MLRLWLSANEIVHRRGIPRAVSSQRDPCIYPTKFVYSRIVSKHRIDVDDHALSAARAELGTTTIKDTVNEALRRATSERSQRIQQALDVLAGADLEDRADAWR